MKDNDTIYIIIIVIIICLFVAFVHRYESRKKEAIFRLQTAAEKLEAERIKLQNERSKLKPKPKFDSIEEQEAYEKLYTPIGELEGAPSVYTSETNRPSTFAEIDSIRSTSYK